MPGFTLRGFKHPRELVPVALGKLEREVMEAAWQGGEISVRDLHRQFGESVAYTTLMTTLDRLYKKGLLGRRKKVRAFLYKPLFTRVELERGITKDVVDGLLAGHTSAVEPVLSCIVDAVSEHDRDMLDELDRLIKEKKRELQNKS
ncbi:MAG TPA: BlaI/MecI/CopY family transcriptional regulator [Pyrinomonadaceae bacterium]|nr:BlaI/MecI/CopY family transcriptional regulator [Pyrinomonadaceae bacterium]